MRLTIYLDNIQTKEVRQSKAIEIDREQSAKTKDRIIPNRRDHRT